jgi:predicted nuclease with TOPRIM domain
MGKISIAIYFISIIGAISHVALAQTAAVEAAAVFRESEELQKSHMKGADVSVANAIDDLKEMTEEGNRLLLNQKVDEARSIAQQVEAQMELVRMLLKLVEIQERLQQLQTSSHKLREKVILLKGQYRRLILEWDGRAMTGAYPAKNEDAGGRP